ncbi:leucine-rich repeat-containing protein 71-like [Rhinoraja longicauda]
MTETAAASSAAAAAAAGGPHHSNPIMDTLSRINVSKTTGTLSSNPPPSHPPWKANNKPPPRTVVLDGNPIATQPYHLLLTDDSPIQNLTLRNNQIDDAGVKLMGEALSTTKKCNTTLVSLNLNFNHITDVGIGYLANGLRLNRSLLWLSVAYNHIGDVGAEKLAEVLIPFALTHEEIVERRLLQLNSHERMRTIALPRRPESKSDRSSQIASSTTLDKSQRSGRGASKKKDKVQKDTTIPEKPVPSASQVLSKRDDIRLLKRGSISADFKFNKTKVRSAKDRRNISMDQEAPGSQRPLLEVADHRDGQVYLAGNTCLLSLNLAHNRITETGLKALLEALKAQVGSNKASLDGRNTSGLLRLLMAVRELPYTHRPIRP